MRRTLSGNGFLCRTVETSKQSDRLPSHSGACPWRRIANLSAPRRPWPEGELLPPQFHMPGNHNDGFLQRAGKEKPYLLLCACISGRCENRVQQRGWVLSSKQSPISFLSSYPSECSTSKRALRGVCTLQAAQRILLSVGLMKVWNMGIRAL